MIGSFAFALGALLCFDPSLPTIMPAGIFFLGTLFFPSAAYVPILLSGEIAKLGPFELLTERRDIPVFAFKRKEPTNDTVFDLSERLRERGWILREVAAVTVSHLQKWRHGSPAPVSSELCKQPHKGGTDFVREETRAGSPTHP